MFLWSEGSFSLWSSVILANSGFSQALQGIIAKFSNISWSTLLTHLISTVFVLAAVIWWLWQPTNKFVAKHKEKLNKTYKDLTVANRESTRYLRLLKKESQEMITIKQDAINKVQADAASIIENAKKLARDEANAITENAHKKAKLLEENARKVIKDSVVNLAVDLTKKLVADNINQTSSKKIIDNYIKEMESKSITDASK